MRIRPVARHQTIIKERTMFKKILASAALATLLASSAGAQTMHSFFANTATFKPTSELELESFNSPGAGTVEIFDYSGGVQGAVLGSADVTEGANSGVKISLAHMANSDVLAVLKVEGQVIGMDLLRISDR
jgi:hypothetical protein